MSRPGSFPVGKVNFLDLHPVSFLEFLKAMGKPRYAECLLELTEPEPLPEAIHSDLNDLLRTYYFVGGMPEAVRSYAEAGDVRIIRQIQGEILDSYSLDFAKHAPITDIPKLGLIWDSIPRHLAKENKKFMFSAVWKGALSREYENALRWLRDAGLVHFCYAVSASRSPLKHYADRSVFKVYALDVGLVGAMARPPRRSQFKGTDCSPNTGGPWPKATLLRSWLRGDFRICTTGEAQEGRPNSTFWSRSAAPSSRSRSRRV